MKTKITALITTAALIAIVPAIGTSLGTAETKSKSAMKVETSKKATTPRGKKITETSRKLTSDLTTTQKSKLLTLLNEGTDKELVAIDGVAKVRAQSIVKARPFEAVEEVTLVSGVGKVTFEKVIRHGKSLTARRSSTSKKG